LVELITTKASDAFLSWKLQKRKPKARKRQDRDEGYQWLNANSQAMLPKVTSKTFGKQKATRNE